MPSAIGVRVYQMVLTRERKSTALPFSETDLPVPVPVFLSDFVASRSDSTEETEAERTWYFEPQTDYEHGGSQGYIHYGSFGFESNLRDSKTKKTKYRREVSDVEEIPLFYDFWHPENADFAMMLFQSFQGRSCYSLVSGAMQAEFSRRNPGFALRFRKLMPAGAFGAYAEAPVKGLRLIKNSAGADLADRYLGKAAPEDISFQVFLRAKRKNFLGYLADISEKFSNRATGVVLHDGVAWDRAVADVQVGKKTRSVHVFGPSADAGVIDITNDVERGPNGHPTLDSMVTECDAILHELAAPLLADRQ